MVNEIGKHLRFQHQQQFMKLGKGDCELHKIIMEIDGMRVQVKILIMRDQYSFRPPIVHMSSQTNLIKGTVLVKEKKKYTSYSDHKKKNFIFAYASQRITRFPPTHVDQGFGATDKYEGLDNGKLAVFDFITKGMGLTLKEQELERNDEGTPFGQESDSHVKWKCGEAWTSKGEVSICEG
ncbi:hypothetical protein BDF20DRAFT_834755 [Mycotypha africana]|uniref:uncharacterized protein n=1 Tax=Mycotypha africana TaxID=64632 RepID=UPI0023016EB6|nr:uncharacterized protein BDF20DRAFT_834755 [Mycotypha africana]KAI8982101.1 hypothetical protein BDF20DRAFT_834755 [Mycotypha africana]